MSAYINKTRSKLFFHGHIISTYTTHLISDSFSKSNLEKKVKKVKESYLNIVKSELKQYQTQSAITCLRLKIEILEQGVKYV